MKKRVERLRGMYDLLPETYHQQRWLMGRLGDFLSRAGYVQVDSPILEQSDLFQASFGQDLWQNLYSFRLHHRELCLRPEYTASICRMYLDHYQQQPLPLRFHYAGPIFRYESPGRERYRQHTQLGIELFGGQSALADAEIVLLACDVLHELQISRYRLELGHIGVASGFINRLKLDDQAARLLLSLMEQIGRSEEGEQLARARLEALYPQSESDEKQRIAHQDGSVSEAESRLVGSLLGGMDIPFGDDADRREVIERFLWKIERSEQRRQILYGLEFLQALHAVSGPPPEVFHELRALLARYELDPEPLRELEQLVEVIEQSGVPREQIILNLSLGRGVSYYTGLVFEIHAENQTGSNTQLCGGGRYDHLMRAVGSSRDVKACGFAFGLERLLTQLPASEVPELEATAAVVIPVSEQDAAYAMRVARQLRLAGTHIELDITGHGVGSGLKLAARKKVRYALIVGEVERQAETVTLRDLETSEEQSVPLKELVPQLLTREGKMVG
ncbi:MAG TPA: HisS family protein [Ktedonobacteraceae bacterium]|nr:HisS family protein [Ktedonobacteraceae bacterium]